MEYITTKEASAKWGITPTRITILANEGRIPGAQRLGKNWLIPASATKPEERKKGKAVKYEASAFSFPLYPFRPDWSHVQNSNLSNQQRRLMQAEVALLECRFTDAYSLLRPIIKKPDDIYIEIGALWSAGMCCIFLNKPDDFSKHYFKLEMLLSEDFPHRDDLVVTLDILKTYIQSISEAAENTNCNTSVHVQSLPMTCLCIGYTQLSKEAIHPGSVEISLLELTLRFLETTSSIISIELFHCHLISVYNIRENMAEVEKHARAVIKLAYESKITFPLITYYRYSASLFDSILADYPEKFQNECHIAASEYTNNFSSFLLSFNESSVLSKLSSEDFLYTFAILTELTNTETAKKIGVSVQTVKRRLSKLCEKFNVGSKKELTEFLRTYL